MPDETSKDQFLCRSRKHKFAKSQRNSLCKRLLSPFKLSLPKLLMCCENVDDFTKGN